MQLQASFDPLYTLDDLVDRDLLTRICFVANGHFAFHADHRRFETRHAMLQVSYIVSDLVDTTAYVAQVLETRLSRLLLMVCTKVS